MNKEPDNKVPDLSIDEALQLYLSITYPKGLPEGEEGEKILKALREKIAKDRPEWAEASRALNKKDKEDTPKRYSELKDKIAEEANKEEIPEDPEERYLYLRRKEAKENSLRKKEEDKEVRREEALRKGAIDQKKADHNKLLKRAALIKKAILQKASQRISPRFENPPAMENGRPNLRGNPRPSIEGNQHKALSFSETVEIKHTIPGYGLQHAISSFTKEKDPADEKPIKDKPDAGEWFKGFKNLSMEDRGESIKEFNLRKREMLQTRDELMWSRRPSPKKDYGFSLDDDGFDLDTDLSFEADKKANIGFRLE